MRIAIVNDMALACEALRRVVASLPEHRVAWTAHDGLEAIERARADRPDLILMDLMMPQLDGVEATRRIMTEAPCPILVVTATVAGHMSKVYEAMGHGALDAVDTPTLGPRGEVAGASALVAKIGMVGRLTGHIAAKKAPAVRAAAAQAKLVLIGASTGGPNALADILCGFPEGWNASLIIIQHVDATFAHGLANWLGERCGHRIDLVAEGDAPAEGRWFLAGTDDHLIMNSGRKLSYTAEPRELCFRPSVDVFFSSAAAHWPEPGVAALLTGMGSDGAQGLLKLRKLGWHTIAQDEATSVVWGMPRAAAAIGAATQVIPLPRIAQAIVARTKA